MDDQIEYTNEDLKLYVLNEANIPISKKYIENMLKMYNIDHKVKNLAQYQTAMVHTSYLNRDLRNDRIVKLVKEKNLEQIPKKDICNTMPLCDTSYERLEFLGDSVIHLVLADYLHDRYRDEQEGFMTRLRTKIESGETLAYLSKVIGLDKYVVIARNIEQIGGRDTNAHILEDCFEAFIGSLFLESSFDICKKLVVKLVEKYVDFSDLIHVETNYKDTLLQCYHKWKWPDPEYGSSGFFEKDNKKYFSMYVKGFNNSCQGDKEWTIVGKGSGTSKKKGEQEAARDALVYFGVLSTVADIDDEIIEDFIYE